MAQRDERIAVAPRDRGVGDGEGGGLDAAAVVPLDDLLGDVARHVGDELLARGGELGEVVGEGRRRACAARRARCACCAARNSPAAKSNRSESRLIAGHAISMPSPSPARIASSSFLPRTLAPVWRRTTVAPSCGCARYDDRLGEERVGALLDAGDAHEARLAEQRRRRDGEQRAGGVVVGTEVGDLEARVLGAQIVADAGDGTLGADLFGAGHEHDRSRLGFAPRQLRDRAARRPRSGCVALLVPCRPAYRAAADVASALAPHRAAAPPPPSIAMSPSTSVRAIRAPERGRAAARISSRGCP